MGYSALQSERNKWFPDILHRVPLHYAFLCFAMVLPTALPAEKRWRENGQLVRPEQVTRY
jgi:hypothetical protein